MDMRCDDIRELMSAHLDGNLTPDEEGRLTSHLADCPDCRRDMEALRTTVRFLQDLEPVTPPPDLVEKVHARLQRRQWGFASVVGLPQVRLALAAGLLIVLTVYGVRVMSPSSRIASDGVPEDKYSVHTKAAADRLRPSSPAASAKSETAPSPTAAPAPVMYASPEGAAQKAPRASRPVSRTSNGRMVATADKAPDMPMAPSAAVPEAETPHRKEAEPTVMKGAPHVESAGGLGRAALATGGAAGMAPVEPSPLPTREITLRVGNVAAAAQVVARVATWCREEVSANEAADSEPAARRSGGQNSGAVTGRTVLLARLPASLYASLPARIEAAGRGRSKAARADEEADAIARDAAEAESGGRKAVADEETLVVRIILIRN
jgi:anti-sigma factor RsiW